jgi:hypothetical protein
MPKIRKTGSSIEEISKQVAQLRRTLARFEPSPKALNSESTTIQKFVNDAGKLFTNV